MNPVVLAAVFTDATGLGFAIYPGVPPGTCVGYPHDASILVESVRVE
jgi:hypothetical protein